MPPTRQCSGGGDRSSGASAGASAGGWVRLGRATARPRFRGGRRALDRRSGPGYRSSPLQSEPLAFLFHLLAALALAVAHELGAPRPATGPAPLAGALAAFVAAALAPFALGAVARRAAVAGRAGPARLAARALDLVGLAGFGGVLWAGWGDVARTVGGDGASVLEWAGPGLALLLVPFVALELAAIGARARLLEPPGEARRSYRRFQARMLMASIVPLALYVGLTSLVGLSRPLEVHVQEVALLGSLFVFATLGLFGVFLPLVLRRVWDTVPLPEGPLRDVLGDLARRARFRFGELLLWRTGGRVANAAIVGFTPRQRVVLLTDGLLAQLSLAELRAVFAHEMGHAARRHVLVFAAWTLTVFLGVDLALMLAPPPSDTAAAVALLAAGLFWFLTFGHLSRRAELEADLFALEVGGDPEALVRALDRVGGGAGRWRDGWRHFSVAHRILFMRAVAADPAVGERLRRGLRRWARVGAVGFVVLAGAWVVAQWRDVDAQRAVAELRLGHYAAAERLAAAAGDGHVELAALAGRGAALERDGGAPTPAALLARAGAAFDAGDRRDAEALLWLAALRDSQAAAAVLDALHATPDERPAALRGLDDAWRARFSAPAPADAGAGRE